MTLRLHGIIRRFDDVACSDRLHHIERHGGAELLFVPLSDVSVFD